MAYTTIDDPTAYFQIELYTGDGEATRAHTFDSDTDMSPDLVWLKKRNTDGFHVLTDSVRGTGKMLATNNTDGEATNSNGGYVSAFDSDGFTTTNGTVNELYVNTDGSIYIAWCWKESATAGFDIVTYSGTGSAKTESHSLSAVPHFIMVKRRSSGGNSWVLYHDKLATAVSSGQLVRGSPEDFTLAIDATAARVDEDLWSDTAPTSSVFSVETANGVNASSSTYLAYCFAPIQGFSKFGTYVGNGDASDGTWVNTGFRSAFIIIKNAEDAGNNWFGFSYNTAGYNGETNHMVMNEDEADVTNSYIDIYSNGFKPTTTDGGLNTDGSVYVYMAWAEMPFVNSSGVPATAR